MKLKINIDQVLLLLSYSVRLVIKLYRKVWEQIIVLRGVIHLVRTQDSITALTRRVYVVVCSRDLENVNQMDICAVCL